MTDVGIIGAGLGQAMVRVALRAGRSVLFEDAGFAVIDLGDLARGVRCNRSTTRSPAST